MELIATACCAVEEIDGLANWDDPKDAMTDLCERMLKDADGYDERVYRNKQSGPNDLIVPGFITFTAVVGYTDKAEKHTYGPKFAAFIKRHNLGTVVESPVRVNRMNHPTHKVKVYVWATSLDGLTKWWVKNDPQKGKREVQSYPEDRGYSYYVHGPMVGGW